MKENSIIKIYKNMKFIKFACILLIAMSITLGCSQGNSGENESSGIKQNSKAEQTQPAVQQTAPTGETDQFGRKPGDPHYGHGHAPGEAHQQPGATPINSQQAPPAGGPDSRGRNPGDPHYGHDHD